MKKAVVVSTSALLGSASEADNKADAERNGDVPVSEESFARLTPGFLRRPAKKPASVETAARNRKNGIQTRGRNDFFLLQCGATSTAGTGLEAPEACANESSIGSRPARSFSLTLVGKVEGRTEPNNGTGG